MPDISINAGITVKKEFLDTTIRVSNVTADMTVVGMQSTTYSTGTAAVSISTANLSSVGFAFMRNVSATTASTVRIGIVSGTSFVDFSTLRAGEPAVFRLSSGVQYQAVGSSGARLRVDIMEG
jgi:hypothetical protein